MRIEPSLDSLSLSQKHATITAQTRRRCLRHWLISWNSKSARANARAFNLARGEDYAESL